MIPALIVAGATVREHSRRKLIAFFVIMSALLMVVLLFVAANLETRRIFFGPTPAGAFVMAGLLGTFALIAAIATSMGNIGRAFNSGEALLVLARPISRAQYVLGRYSGGVAVIWGLAVLFALETQIVNQVAAGRMSGIAWEHWGILAVNLAIVAAVTTLLSSFISNPIVAAVMAYLAYQVIGAAELLYRLAKAEFLPGPFAVAARVLWYLTPKFLVSPFSRVQGSTGSDFAPFLGSNSVGLVGWAMGWFLGLLALCILIATRKDL